MNKRLSVAVAAAGLLAALATPAAAAVPTSASVKDPSGDLRSFQTGLPTSTTNGIDLLSLSGAKSTARLRVLMLAKDINSTNANPAKVDFHFDVYVGGRRTFSVRRTGGGHVLTQSTTSLKNCVGGQWVADQVKNTVRFYVPVKCFGSPRRISIIGNSYAGKVYDQTDPTAVFALR